jgi:hypothetical protein
MDDNFNVNLRGEGVYFPKIIQTKNPLQKEMTILELYNMLTKAYKKIIPPTCTPYIYVILPDDFCGFIPLPSQTLGELARIHSNKSGNTGLTIKITDKAHFG